MKRVGDVFSVLFDEGLMKKAKSYSTLFSCWRDLMEKNNIPAAADHSWVKDLKRNVVWIEVDHPGWKQIIQTKQSKLLYDFRYRFPDMNICGLSILLCKNGSAENGRTADTAEISHNDETEKSPVLVEVNEIQSSAYDSIKDEKLKKILMQLEKRINERSGG